MSSTVLSSSPDKLQKSHNHNSKHSLMPSNNSSTSLNSLNSSTSSTSTLKSSAIANTTNGASSISSSSKTISSSTNNSKTLNNVNDPKVKTEAETTSLKNMPISIAVTNATSQSSTKESLIRSSGILNTKSWFNTQTNNSNQVSIKKEDSNNFTFRSPPSSSINGSTNLLIRPNSTTIHNNTIKPKILPNIMPNSKIAHHSIPSGSGSAVPIIIPKPIIASKPLHKSISEKSTFSKSITNHSNQSNSSPSVELQTKLSSKVKENEKLKLIIDKLRNEINLLKALQDSSINSNINEINNDFSNKNLSNLSFHEIDENDKNIDNLPTAVKMEEQDTINPMKLSNNISSLGERDDLKILNDINSFLIGNEIKNNTTKKTSKKKNLTRKSTKKSSKVKTDETTKNCISHSMLNLSLIDPNKQLNMIMNSRDDNDDGVLDEKFASQSPSPSLSLSVSNTSEFTELDIDSLLLLSSISPSTTNTPQHEKDLEMGVNQYLNNSHHPDPNTLKKLLLNNSVQLERTTSWTSNEDDGNHNHSHTKRTLKKKTSPLKRTIKNNNPNNYEKPNNTNINIDNSDEDFIMNFLTSSNLDPLFSNNDSNMNYKNSLERIKSELLDENYQSLKLERSISVPTYVDDEHKNRPIKHPTKHIKKEQGINKNTTCNIEACGFCVDGAPCLCEEAANESNELTNNSQKSRMEIKVEEDEDIIIPDQ